MKTPEQIAAMQAQFIYAAAHEVHVTDVGANDAGLAATERATLAAIEAAIEADREQRHHWDAEIYIVQNDAGDVVDTFWDADEASAAYQAGYSIIAETAWEPGEYAEQRIRTLTEQWEEAVNDGRDESEEPYRASDHVLSEDDWRTGLDDEEAAEIARLIEWQGADK